MSRPDWQVIKSVFERSLELPSEQRVAFVDAASGDDADLAHEVRTLLRSHERAGDFLETPAAAQFPVTGPGTLGDYVGQTVGPYRIVAEVGRGGMGAVFRARRQGEGYTQEVALKLLAAGEATGLFVDRFKLERRILAGLEHPNIARLIDGGTLADGRPYYAMEFVDGRPLDAYCIERDLDIRARLGLFATVCEAVAFAHRNLVVHRDLKPGNILVSPDGVPKLLDFGIAKLLSSEEAEPAAQTVTGLSMMTPEFASPEQVRGDVVTTATDVYALGVILYLLLAGRRPYELPANNHEEIVRLVCHDDPPAPSAVVYSRPRSTSRAPGGRARRRGGDRDLDTIVMKALKKDPVRRYGTASELAEDIRRYLAGQPVQARPDTARYRASKFVARHRVGVAGATAALLAILAGSAAAVYEARVAEAQRQRADRRFLDVRRIANSLVFELNDSIADVPGTTAARGLLLARASELFDTLAADAPDDPVLGEEVAAAYHRLGDVLGATRSPATGKLPSALEAHRRGLEIRTQLAKAAPTDTDRQSRLASSLIDVSYATPDGREGLSYARAAVDVASQITGSNPTGDDPRKRFANARFALGVQLVQAGQFDAAVAEFEQAAVLYDALLRDQPGVEANLRNVTLAHKRVGAILTKRGQPAEALSHYRTALAADEARLAREPQSAEARYDLSVTLVDLGVTLGASGDWQGQVEHNLRALSLRKALMAGDPANTRIRGGVRSVLCKLANASVQRGQFGEARRYVEWGRAVADENDPGSTATLDMVMADVEANAGRWDAAVRWTTEALALNLGRAAAAPRGSAARIDAAWTALRHADALVGRAGQQARGPTSVAADLRDAETHYRDVLTRAADLQARGALVGGDAALVDRARAGLDRCARGLGQVGSASHRR